MQGEKMYQYLLRNYNKRSVMMGKTNLVRAALKVIAFFLRQLRSYRTYGEMEPFQQMV